MTAAHLWRRGWELAMADKSALGIIGLMLCTTTALVMMIGAVVVNDHLTGRLQIDAVATSNRNGLVFEHSSHKLDPAATGFFFRM